MYAHKKENSPGNNKSSGKEAQLRLSRAILTPILAHYEPQTYPQMAKRSESILAPVKLPETNAPSYAGEKHVQVAGDIVGDKALNLQDRILCSTSTKQSKQAEVNKIAEILQKKALVLSYNMRQKQQEMAARQQAAQQAAQAGGQGYDVGGNISGLGQYGHGAGSGLGAGGVGAGEGNGQPGQGNAAPSTPQGSPLPVNVGKDYQQFLNSARSSIAQARMNQVIPPPMGSTPPPVVATYPGMNSAPTKSASNVTGSSLHTGIKPLAPVDPHFQASNIVAKGQSQFAKGNDALLNTIGKLSPFKTEGGKVDITAGMSGGAYGNLPNTPKTQALG